MLRGWLGKLLKRTRTYRNSARTSHRDIKSEFACENAKIISIKVSYKNAFMLLFSSYSHNGSFLAHPRFICKVEGTNGSRKILFGPQDTARNRAWSFTRRNAVQIRRSYQKFIPKATSGTPFCKSSADQIISGGLINVISRAKRLSRNSTSKCTKSGNRHSAKVFAEKKTK